MCTHPQKGDTSLQTNGMARIFDIEIEDSIEIRIP
jgi:hypothetical protein